MEFENEALAFITSIIGEVEDEAALLALIRGTIQSERELAALAARIAAFSMAKGILDAVESAIRKGLIGEDLSQADIPNLISEGLGRNDPGVGFQAGLRTAYNKGRYERAKRTGMSYLVYRTIGDARVRQSHRKLNAVALPIDDPFWDTHFPPNGWRCRCITYAVEAEDIDELEADGIKVKRQAPQEELIEHTDKVTGEKFKLPESIEPGWQYGPDSANKQLKDALTRSKRAIK